MYPQVSTPGCADASTGCRYTVKPTHKHTPVSFVKHYNCNPERYMKISVDKRRVA